MKTTVFGHTGFIGSNFVSKFSDVDSLYLPPRYSRRPLSDSDEIINFISTTHNYNVFDDPTLDVKTNLVLLTEMLESWRNNAPNAVFSLVSSWFVYGNNGVHRCSEESPCHPMGFYSITKRCAEQLVQSFAETFGLKYRILRLGNVIGKGDDGCSAKKNAFQFLFNQMAAGAESIPVYEHGDFYRNYSHVGDICSYLRFVMENGAINTTYNIGNYENYKFMDMLEYAKHVTNWQGRFDFIEQKPFHKTVQVKSFHMDCRKLWHLGHPIKKVYRHYGMEGMVYSLL